MSYNRSVVLLLPKDDDVVDVELAIGRREEE